jgi:hypothetical protein
MYENNLQEPEVIRYLNSEIQRYHIINYLIEKYKLVNYLEIGVFKGENIMINQKFGKKSIEVNPCNNLDNSFANNSINESINILNENELDFKNSNSYKNVIDEPRIYNYIENLDNEKNTFKGISPSLAISTKLDCLFIGFTVYLFTYFCNNLSLEFIFFATHPSCL